MSLHLHRAERADVLVDALADVLAPPLANALATEALCVPTPGVERWIAQRLSHRLGAGPGEDGVCAGVDFPSPRRLVRAALGDPQGDDPWSPARSVWPLLTVLEEAVAEPWGAVLAGYLGGASGADGGGTADDGRTADGAVTGDGGRADDDPRRS